MITLAPFTVSVPPSRLMTSGIPFIAGTATAGAMASPLSISASSTRPATAWKPIVTLSLVRLAGFIRSSRICAGSLANAASLGANTVIGPGD